MPPAESTGNGPWVEPGGCEAAGPRDSLAELRSIASLSVRGYSSHRETAARAVRDVYAPDRIPHFARGSRTSDHSESTEGVIPGT